MKKIRINNCFVDAQKKILLENGYNESDDNILWKKDNDIMINYISKFNSISYSYEKSGFSYRYKYWLTDDLLEVSIYDENYSIVQDYDYDIDNNKMDCIVGSCNDYKSVLKILDENVLYLFE